ncbi:MAG: glucans biosynthesis glucosyltransferase MdoH [Pseudomonadota bacterium]
MAHVDAQRTRTPARAHSLHRTGLQTRSASAPAVSASVLSSRLSDRRMAWRRTVFAIAVSGTVAALFAAMTYVLAHAGWSILEAGLLVAFTITLPWLAIGFWNALIGFFLLAGRRNPVALVSPELSNLDEHAPITTRTAIAMAIRNEEPEQSIGRLRAMFADLDRAGVLAHFEFHVLSDTNDPSIAAREEAYMARWEREAGRRGAIHYRRRTSNEGFKAGNIAEFCERVAGTVDYFLPLDADSFMSARAVIRLVQGLQQNPQIGLLQGLVVGTPAASLFTRTFQFGMRHGMRAFTIGGAWWQGDCGPYWGHNALIRLDVFREACRLPVLPGTGPLSGHILSHDQVEAVLIRRAGYDVRVLATEDESWEENPPSLPEFIGRELRWCQGNMQYFQLLGIPGLKPISRIQLALAILMYVSPIAWMAFLAISVGLAISAPASAAFPADAGLALFCVILLMSFMPKLMGLASILVRPRQRRRYGGALRIIAGGLLEFILSALMAPVVGLSIAIFAVGLLFGRKLDWQAQTRCAHTVSWRNAASAFWPHTLAGLGMLVAFALNAPALLLWGGPVVFGLLLSIPFTVLTTSAAAGRFSRSSGLCNIPEDRRPPLPLRRLLGDQQASKDSDVVDASLAAGAK